MANENDDATGIAIIGMSGRYPGARNLSEFWKNIREGRESITTLDEATLLAAGVEPSALVDPTYVRAASIVDDIELFDAPLFDITPAEARLLDPQHRLFLECAWEALEQGGYRSSTAGLSIGVYGSAMMSSYLLNNLMHHPSMQRARNGLNMSSLQVIVGNDRNYMATRLAYKLDLQGPCCIVQNACSSSLMALHLACQALLAQECDFALAGGAAIRVPQNVGYYHEPGSIVSSDGHCRPFDARGEGTLFGSGVGVVLLRRLEDALDCGDHIWAVVRGSAANNDGSLKMGFTAPSVDAQSRVIEEAIHVASVSPDSIEYIETHGTGTSLGDPIEIAALTQAFRSRTKRKQFCAIGSVKSNIGHLESASGITGLIKAALALHHKEIPPSLHFDEPNPQIDFDSSPFFVNTELRPWEKRDGVSRRAGVTSLGIGGTNVHVVLEEAPERTRKAGNETRPWQMLMLSAHSRTSLDDATKNLAVFLDLHPEVELANVAFTLNVGRATLRHRRVVVCRDIDDARAVLSGKEPSRLLTSVHEKLNPPVAFMFPGQGTQYLNMGWELLKTEATFRSCVDQCAEILQPVLKKDIRNLIYPDAARLEMAGIDLQQTAITQPALFCIEYALARTWIDRGITPSVLLGHSVGELVAACLAEVFTLADALQLVALRGRLIQELPAGAMLSIPLSPEGLEPYLIEGAGVAAINEPNRTVISGPVRVIEACAERLAKASIDYRLLYTSHAFHSAMLEPVLDRFANAVAKVPRRPPTLRCLSNVSGSWLTDEQAQDPLYWAQQVRQPVQFAKNLNCLLSEGPAVLVEVGPGRTLTKFAQAHPSLRKGEHPTINSMRHTSESTSDVAVFLNALGQLWLRGVSVNWKNHWQGEQRRREPLPTYSFDRQRYWVEPPVGHWSASSDGANETGQSINVTESDSVTSDSSHERGPERPDVSTPYAPPRTATESLLIELWRELLGIRVIGIYDNFFELGGDSVLGVQLASKANARGIRVSPKHLFDHPCIADLATAIDEATATKAIVTDEAQGPQPLLPIQSWLIERMPEFRDWISVTVFEAREPMDVEALEETLQALRASHSALRTRFEERPTGWVQEVILNPQPQRVTCIDLSNAEEQEFHARIQECAQQACKMIALSKGESMQWVVVRGNARAGINDRFIVAMHHWVLDIAGEFILMRDLNSVYTKRLKKEPIHLAESGTSMATFASILVQRAQQQSIETERNEWLRPARAGVRSLPWLKPRTLRSRKDIITIEQVLDTPQTSRLLHDLQRLQHVTLEEIALSAVLSALADWSGEESLLLDVEMSARHADHEGVDLTRSIGWFTTICPLFVELEHISTPRERLATTVRSMRKMRQREHEYGMLRYLSPDSALRARLAKMPQPDVFFGYFGDVYVQDVGYGGDNGDVLFQVDPVTKHLKHAMLGTLGYPVEVTAFLRSGSLCINWIFDQRLLSQEQAAKLAELCMRSLNALAEDTVVGVSHSVPALSESGFVTGHQLDEILAELGQDYLSEHESVG